MGAPRKTVRFKVSKIVEVFQLGRSWWARVIARGSRETITVELGFETEDKARNCVGLVFDRTR